MAAQLKLGVTSWKYPESSGFRALCEQAELAEKMGATSFWVPENHFQDQRSMPAPLTLLAAVAARTSRIQLGTVSYLLPIRQPLLAAEEVAVLDQLCEGRLILGVGRGIQDDMFQAFGFPLSEKRKVFARHLSVMRAAWSGQPVGHNAAGEPIILAPLPVQPGGPPIWVAAFGPLALKQVGGLGLPYLASPVESLRTLYANYQQFRAAVAQAGHPMVTTTPVMRTVYVSDNSRQLAQLKDALQKFSPVIRNSKPADIDEWAIVGDACYVKDTVQQYRDTLGMTHLIASGRLPGLSGEEVVHSHEQLLHLLSC